jgi:hypothetical protein
MERLTALAPWIHSPEAGLIYWTGAPRGRLLDDGVSVHYLELLHDRLAVWEGR